MYCLLNIIRVMQKLTFLPFYLSCTPAEAEAEVRESRAGTRQGLAKLSSDSKGMHGSKPASDTKKASYRSH